MDKSTILGRSSQGLLVHEWLEKTGGAENVFEQICEVFSDSTKYCLWNNSDGRFLNVNESILAKSFLKGKKALSLPFMPFVWRYLPKENADWVLVDSHLFAHHVRFSGQARKARKYVYVHTPARYIWNPELDERGNSWFVKLVSPFFRIIDRNRAKEAYSIAANSQFVADRIEKNWGRKAIVIHPSIDVLSFERNPQLSKDEQQTLDAIPPDFLLGISRFVPYKRLDLVIRAGYLTDKPVVIAGTGPEEAQLRKLAEGLYPGKVFFIIEPSDELKKELFSKALALVFPPIEDFGIVPLEAMASGTPVIADSIGGASETVIDGLTGFHIRNWSDTEIIQSLSKIHGLNSEVIVNHSKQFDHKIFKAQILKWINKE